MNDFFKKHVPIKHFHSTSIIKWLLCNQPGIHDHIYITDIN